MIPPAEVEEFVLSLPLVKISGVCKVTAARLTELGLAYCVDVRRYDLAKLLHQFGQMGRMLWERSHSRHEREVMPYRLRKSIGVERTIANDIYHWEECELLLNEWYRALEQRLNQIQPKRAIARQGVKVKFHDLQQTTQEHICSQLERQD